MGFSPISCLPAGASATRDLSLRWLAWFMPVALIAAALFALMIWLFVILKRRYTSSATFLAGDEYEKAMITDTISGYFFCAGYLKAEREGDEITFSRDSRYDLVLGALLFLFFILPGILYLLIFAKELRGRLCVQSIDHGHIVAIYGPREVVDRARLSFEDRGRRLPAAARGGG